MKKILKNAGAWVMLLVLCLTVICQNSIISEAVTPSSKDYRVVLNGARFFIHNEKTVGSKVGTEYFMTYTVDSAKQKATQQGVIGTEDVTRNFPYTSGGFMRYSQNNISLMDEGATYFIKFTVVEDGYNYKIARAMGDQLEHVALERREGDSTDKMGYFGLWLAYDKVEAELSNVRFYDADGNDLGVQIKFPSGNGYVMQEGVKLEKTKGVNHLYEVKVTEGRNIAISNVKVPTSSTIYMEYKVDSAEYLLNQNGIALSNEPKSDYPHRHGILKHVTHTEIKNSIELLQVGAEYIIRIERGAKDFDVTVQRTKGNQTDLFMINLPAGTYDSTFPFVSLWFGAGGQTSATFHLKDFKIYDANKNNLGVQCNVNSEITHTGELEDYAGCEAAYYCEENGNFIALYENQTMKHTKDAVTEDAKYTIVDNVMKASYAKGVETYEYLYRRITDNESKIYNRLYNYQVNFVTGTDTEIPTQNLTNETGYQAMRPDQPTLEGYEFQGWYTSDKKEFDFNTIVTESTTLYAKWSGDGGVTFIADDEAKDVEKSIDKTTMGILIAGGIGLVLVGLVICVGFIRKGIKHGNVNEKKETIRKN